jgi:protein-tyrosine-phosphatase
MLIRSSMAEAAIKATLARHPAAAAVRTAGAASAANGEGALP